MDIDTEPTVTVDSLLQSFPSLKRIPDKERIRCIWTQHEMPARVDAMVKYVQGKKYQQTLKKMNKADSFEQFRAFLEPSAKKNHENQLFCKLTWRHLNKEPHHIMKHIQGKRFKRAFLHWQECQANGTEYTPIGRRKKKQGTVNGDDDDDQYEDLSDDEIVVEDEEDDLSDLYPDFRRLRASDGKVLPATTTSAAAAQEEEEQDDATGGTKRKAQASQMKKPKKLAAPSSKRMRSSDDTTMTTASKGGDELIKPTKTMTITL